MKNLQLNLIEFTSLWPTWVALVPVDELLDVVKKIQASDGQLLTLWGSDERSQQYGFRLHLVFIFWNQGVLYLQCDLSGVNPSYPDLSSYFPVANRLQRALFDLLGIKANDSEDERAWLRHNAWPSDIFPLREEIKLTDRFANEDEQYPFVRVHGEGVHEIPVGPVHAGIIEPGHFRFHAVGERILRLEERLGYAHKGIAKHFQHCSFIKGTQLAGRISADNTVAYAWAYSMAVEHLYQGAAVSPRAQWLRALLLERERIMNHLGDLGSLGNDAGLSFGLTQFSILKEDMLRLNMQLFGHRYLMDIIVPGGVTADISSGGIYLISQEIRKLQKEVYSLKQCYSNHEGLQDRFMTTGTVSLPLANRLGLLGLSARSSGLAIDWRTKFPCMPYTKIGVRACIEKQGDVGARVLIRFQEIEESLRIIELIIKKLPDGRIQELLPKTTDSRIGFGCIEGWRGPVFFAVCNEDTDHIRWAHVHDPSWQNWLALEHAVLGNIVPDFPLINKSFNLSYSGHDS
ncbi:MAG: NADH-quinone oxidoreductase subunit C [Gammaproteobacteria bacterium]|nr:NADH-quinone oxidoreductase subunit C [Gammaproteobacteria bacterium]